MREELHHLVDLLPEAELRPALELILQGALHTGYLNSYVNNLRAVMNNEGGFLRWVMCDR
jgi:hypothetical protein